MTPDVTYKPVAVDERAIRVILDCRNHLGQVEAHYGPVIANEMWASFGRSLAMLHTFGGTIYPDGDLGLVCSSFIVVGMVFHRDNEATTLRRLNEIHGGNVPIEHLDSSWPATGEWSLHS